MADENASMEYLTITAYSDKAYSSEIGTYVAMVNPDKYSHSFSVQYNEEQGEGSSNASIKFKQTPPSTISFELMFDATGVLDNTRTDLVDELEKFKKLAYQYNGDIHSPNYLELTWGDALSFQCRLTSMSLNYTLFKSNGTPLRAKANVEFKNYEDPKKVEAAAQKASPDMTHERLVKVGDTLPAMSHEIYGDSSYYIQVASFNALDNFMLLEPGTTLYFPHLE